MPSPCGANCVLYNLDIEEDANVVNTAERYQVRSADTRTLAEIDRTLIERYISPKTLLLNEGKLLSRDEPIREMAAIP
jgi:hypothetical protein